MPGTVIVKENKDSSRVSLQQGDASYRRLVATGSKWADMRRLATAATTALAAAILLAFAAPTNVYGRGEKTVTKVEAGKPVPVKSGHIEANGVNYYYEIHGRGAAVTPRWSRID